MYVNSSRLWWTRASSGWKTARKPWVSCSSASPENSSSRSKLSSGGAAIAVIWGGHATLANCARRNAITSTLVALGRPSAPVGGHATAKAFPPQPSAERNNRVVRKSFSLALPPSYSTGYKSGKPFRGESKAGEKDAEWSSEALETGGPSRQRTWDRWQRRSDHQPGAESPNSSEAQVSAVPFARAFIHIAMCCAYNSKSKLVFQYSLPLRQLTTV